MVNSVISKSDSLRSFSGEACGLTGAINIPNAAALVYQLMCMQVKRGEMGSGIVSFDGKTFHMEKSKKNVKNTRYDLQELKGCIAMGHNRYATRGGDSTNYNVQPLFFQDLLIGSFALSHNGTMPSASTIRDELRSNRRLFQTSIDSEIFAHCMVASGEKNLEEAIIAATKIIPNAYSLLILAEDKLIALRDKNGVRPLSFAPYNDGYLVTSESFVYDENSDLQEINPGEMVIFEKGKEPTFIQYTERKPHFCVFELIYFMHPSSKIKGSDGKYSYVEDFRRELGMQLFKDNSLDIIADDYDLCGSLPESGDYGLYGFSEESGILLRPPFIKNRNTKGIAERSFTAGSLDQMIDIARRKLSLRPDRAKYKRVFIYDDSIVRGTTTGINVKRLRDAGCSFIGVGISAPKINHPCNYGMAFATHEELAAYERSTDEVRSFIGSDRLYYQKMDGLKKVVSKIYGSDFGICTGCFDADYPL
jgi:amidophosphoribosyltransferase